mmetsp:Transcript_93866/g.165626  ORF Transcript_93866/g.165626 Transcript_93866/m.165626 type:complete len:227 (-) Transcript_93866:58-738(-)
MQPGKRFSIMVHYATLPRLCLVACLFLADAVTPPTISVSNLKEFKEIGGGIHYNEFEKALKGFADANIVEDESQPAWYTVKFNKGAGKATLTLLMGDVVEYQPFLPVKIPIGSTKASDMLEAQEGMDVFIQHVKEAIAGVDGLHLQMDKVMDAVRDSQKAASDDAAKNSGASPPDVEYFLSYTVLPQLRLTQFITLATLVANMVAIAVFCFRQPKQGSPTSTIELS